MNRKAIQDLIDFYRTGTPIFAMKNWAQRVNCGTAFCIAGQVCINAGYSFRVKGSNYAVLQRSGEDVAVTTPDTVAAGILDLDFQEAQLLFLKDNWSAQFRYLPDTPALAADRLQHFLDTDGKE